MKSVRIISSVLFLIAIALSCSKSIGTIPELPNSSLTIINAINGSNPLVTDFTPVDAKGVSQSPLIYYATANQISYGNAWAGGLPAGMASLTLSQISDTTIHIWTGTFNLLAKNIYSLFLAGDTTSVDTLFTIDVVPYYPASDSVSGVRFVNMSAGSQPLSINLQGNPQGQFEFSNLGYKQITAFKSYSANSSVPGNYNFEIRDQASGNLINTFTWNYSIFKNQTIVISGLENSGFQIFQVNNY